MVKHAKYHFMLHKFYHSLKGNIHTKTCILSLKSLGKMIMFCSEIIDISSVFLKWWWLKVANYCNPESRISCSGLWSMMPCTLPLKIPLGNAPQHLCVRGKNNHYICTLSKALIYIGYIFFYSSYYKETQSVEAS